MTIIGHHDDHLNIFTVLQESDQTLSFKFKYVICSVYFVLFLLSSHNELNTGAMLSLLTDTHVAWVSGMEWVGKIKSVQRVAFLSLSLQPANNGGINGTQHNSPLFLDFLFSPRMISI